MSISFYESDSFCALKDVLFLHGNLASHHWWTPFREEWKKQSHSKQLSGSLIFSDWGSCGNTLKELAQDQLDLLDHLEKKGELHFPIQLVGHSLGGLIALQMLLLKPDLFSHAVLLDPVGAEGVVFDDSMYEAFRQMSEDQELTKKVILGTIKSHSFLTSALKEQISRDAFKAVKGIGSSVLEILKTVDLKDKIHQIKIPVLILHGKHDEVIPLRDSEQLVKLLPHGQLEVLPEAGHCWNLENPSDFTARVKSFLESP